MQGEAHKNKQELENSNIEIYILDFLQDHLAGALLGAAIGGVLCMRYGRLPNQCLDRAVMLGMITGVNHLYVYGIINLGHIILCDIFEQRRVMHKVAYNRYIHDPQHIIIGDIPSELSSFELRNHFVSDKVTWGYSILLRLFRNLFMASIYSICNILFLQNFDINILAKRGVELAKNKFFLQALCKPFLQMVNLCYKNFVTNDIIDSKNNLVKNINKITLNDEYNMIDDSEINTNDLPSVIGGVYEF